MRIRRRSSARARARSLIDDDPLPPVDDFLEANGVGCGTVLVTTALSLACMAQSLLTNLSAYVMPCAGEFFGEPPLVYGTLASVLYTASYISAPVFGVLADHLGRAPTTRLSVAILFIGSMLSTLAPSFSSLLAAQAVLGVGLGGSMAPFSLLAELSPPSVRGIILSSANYFWSLRGRAPPSRRRG